MRLRQEEAEAILYSRADCPLCFAMRRAARRAARRHGLRLRVVDVNSDPVLEARFGREVPVLLLPGGRTIRGPAAYVDVDRLFRLSALSAVEGLPGGTAIAGRAGTGIAWLRRLARRLGRARGEA